MVCIRQDTRAAESLRAIFSESATAEHGGVSWLPGTPQDEWSLTIW